MRSSSSRLCARLEVRGSDPGVRPLGLTPGSDPFTAHSERRLSAMRRKLLPLNELRSRLEDLEGEVDLSEGGRHLNTVYRVADLDEHFAGNGDPFGHRVLP